MKIKVDSTKASFSRAALSTGGGGKNNFLSVSTCCNLSVSLLKETLKVKMQGLRMHLYAGA
jgi:hypothetical protein